MLEEEWREVEGFPNYSVSEFGKVRNNKTGRLLTHSRGGNHWSVKLYKSSGEKVHRLVAKAFLDKPDYPVHEVIHKDGDNSNNHYSNLEWKRSLIYGVGYNTLGLGRKKVKSLNVWKNILARCYSERSKYYHNYGGRGVLVDPVWHDYLVFKEWYEGRIVLFNDQSKVDTDKDILSDGMLYGPDTCCLIPRCINNIFTKNSIKTVGYFTDKMEEYKGQIFQEDYERILEAGINRLSSRHT